MPQAPADTPADAPADMTLEYAPADPLRRRRRTHRIVFALCFLIAAGVAYRFGPALWHGGRTLFFVRQAAGYSASAGRIVYEDDASTKRPLVQVAVYDSGPFKTGIGFWPAPGGTSPPARWAADPPALARFAAVSASPGHFNLFTRRGAAPEPLVFLHERTTPGGSRRIVGVRITGLTYYRADGGTLACTYTAVTVRPNGWKPPTGQSIIRAWGGATAEQMSHAQPDTTAPKEPGAVRLYFGEPDPNDPSAFTVRYDLNGKSRKWRFQLTDKGLDLDERQTVVER